MVKNMPDRLVDPNHGDCSFNPKQGEEDAKPTSRSNSRSGDCSLNPKRGEEDVKLASGSKSRRLVIQSKTWRKKGEPDSGSTSR